MSDQTNPQIPSDAEPQPPVSGQPQRPYPGQPQQPYPGKPQRPYQGQPQRPFPGQPQGGFPGQAQPPYPGQPQGPAQPKKSQGLKGWMIALIVVGGLLVVTGVTFLILFLVGAGPFTKDKIDDQIAAELAEHPELTALYEACASGDMTACDNLFMESPRDSALEAFGNECGGAPRTGMWCDPLFSPLGEESDLEPQEQADLEEEISTDDQIDSEYVGGDLPDVPDGFDQALIEAELAQHPELRSLYEACAAGDMRACDNLYFETERDTELERFGDTCGGTSFDGTYCDAD